MTWVFLTDKRRNEISHKAGPYVADSFVPHEAEVQKLNPRNNWVGLSDEERNAIRATFVTGKIFHIEDMFAALEDKLRSKNT